MTDQSSPADDTAEMSGNKSKLRNETSPQSGIKIFKVKNFQKKKNKKKEDDDDDGNSSTPIESDNEGDNDNQ